MGPPWPPTRPVQMSALHRDRFEGRYLHGRGRLRAARQKFRRME
jgi:hypothetical protein